MSEYPKKYLLLYRWEATGGRMQGRHVTVQSRKHLDNILDKMERQGWKNEGIHPCYEDGTPIEPTI